MLTSFIIIKLCFQYEKVPFTGIKRGFWHLSNASGHIRPFLFYANRNIRVENFILVHKGGGGGGKDFWDILYTTRMGWELADREETNDY